MQWSIIVATLAGPVLAVQAQSFLDRRRARKTERRNLFLSLLTTRNANARLELAHVNALRQIEPVYGMKTNWPFGGKKHKNVIDKYRLYMKSLSPPQNSTQPNSPVISYPEPSQAEVRERSEKFYDLLEAIAEEQGEDFDRSTLESESYIPLLYTNIANYNYNNAIELNKVLSGGTPIKIEVVNVVKPEQQ